MKVLNMEELHKIFESLKENNQEMIFNELYNKYNDLVYRIAFSILKNKESSEDIKQSVFLKIWNMDQVTLPSKNEASWLYTLVKNETLNYIRKQEKTVSLDEIYYIDSENDELNEIIDRESYNKIISKLNKKEQEIVSLKIIAGLSFKEISQIINEPIGTVQWRYYKSLHTLKILLSNLSMFIIAILTFATRIINKTTKKNQSGIKNEVSDVQNSESMNITISADSITQDNNIMENEMTETIIIDKNTKYEIDNLDIGILSVSGIFLILTIIFSIIFIKCQQKAKENVSK